ncbi:unnamed protein product [Arctia plantaginis]|uniref:Uncharacterized protein n=1 Tax=Arctia plantaginis TaxID=874455 RepID=A0A8S0Z445_ARCPL|nr:unnamed protein product [Arctia plantaginis]
MDCLLDSDGLFVGLLSPSVHGFDLSKRQDVNNLLNLLENGTISDLDEESDDEIVQAIPEKIVRVDSNITQPNERVIVDHSEGRKEEYIEEKEPRTGSSNKPKNDIIWRKHLQLEPPQFIWSAPPPSEIDSPLAQIDYFYKYITESLIENFSFNIFKEYGQR